MKGGGGNGFLTRCSVSDFMTSPEGEGRGGERGEDREGNYDQRGIPTPLLFVFVRSITVGR